MDYARSSCRLLDQRAHAGAGAAGVEVGVLDLVLLGVGLGVGDRLGDDLDAPDLARLRRHRQADRADPQQRSKTRSLPLSPAYSAAIA